jgi:hypothetical protein
MKSKREILQNTKKKNELKLKTSTKENFNTLTSTSNVFRSISTSVHSPTYYYNNYDGADIEPEPTIIEECVEIKIPTPYPRNRYMLIEDPNLVNSKYTAMLNEKYPPRKYVKHNLTSWTKQNKNKAKEIKCNFMNPKIRFEDYNLRKITYNNEEIGEGSLDNLDQARELIEKLKVKLIDYELTNNQNIETAMECINSLREEKEFYKNKLVESHEKFNYISEKYNIDPEMININDSKNILVESFRHKWLKFNFFKNLKFRVEKTKRLKFGIERLKRFGQNVLKFKSLLSLEKNYMQSKFKDKIYTRSCFRNLKKIFQSLRLNAYFNKLGRKFKNIQRTIYLMVYLKELKLNSSTSEYYQQLNKRALMEYYVKLTRKSINVLKRNCLRLKGNLYSKINYIQFFKDISKLYKKPLTSKIKNLKTKALNTCRDIVEKIINKSKNKLINLYNNGNINKHIPLGYYFKLWKNNCDENQKETQIKINIRKKIIKSFLSKIKKRRDMKYYQTFNSPTIIKAYRQCFFKNILNSIHIKKKILTFQNETSKKIHQRNFLNHLCLVISDDPRIRLNRIMRKIQYSTFIDNIKMKIANKNKQNKQHKTIHNLLSYKNSIKNKTYPCEFFTIIKNKIKTKSKFKFTLNLFQNKNYKMKNLHKLRIICSFLRMKKNKIYYENVISSVKKILDEKSEMINKIELDNSELALHYENILGKNKNYIEENDSLRKKITNLEVYLEQNSRKFKELWNQNVSDIKSKINIFI